MSLLQVLVTTAALFRLAFETFLKRKNEMHMNLLKEKPPESINGIMDFQTWGKATEYSLQKSKLSRSEDVFEFFLFCMSVMVLFPWTFKTWSTSLDDSIWKCSLVVVCFLTLVQLPSLFFDWKRQFGLETQFGFNKSSLKLWISDKTKELFIGFFLGFLLFALLIWLYRNTSNLSPDFWWILAFLVFFIIQLCLMVLWPKFILPLFNKLSPLEDGELKRRLLYLSEKTGFKAKAIEVIDGSKRSGHSNAYFTGFGKFRRIVLYDTLIEQMNIDELEAVLAHEVGHYRLGHIPKRLLFSFLFGLLGFGILSILLQSEWFYSGLGLPLDLLGSFSSLVVGLSLIVVFFTYWLTPISNYFSRKHEYEADEFARTAVGSWQPLVGALKKLYVENLNHPLPHSFISSFHYSHPTLFEREEALKSRADD